MSSLHSSNDLVEVWRASGETDAQIIRSLLRSFGIDSMCGGESLRLTHGFTLNSLGLVKIYVRRADAERAAAILEDDSD